MRKGIGPVVASSLLLVVAVISLVAFQTWYSSYQSKILTSTENGENNEILSTEIEGLVGDTLYVTSGFDENVSITGIEIGGINCNVTSNLSSGINEINIGNCTQNLTKQVHNILVFTNKTVLDKGIYL